MCFQVGEVRCNATTAAGAGSGCCAMNLDTIRMYVEPTCRSKLVGVWVNGQPHDWAVKLDGRRRKQDATLSVPGLNRKAQQAAGSALTVCMQLVSPCNSLPTFCRGGVCRYSVFNSAESCCPVGSAKIPS